MRSLVAVVLLVFIACSSGATSAYAQEAPSGFATDAPTTPPEATPPPKGLATPVPSASNAPPLNPADYTPYMQRGTGSFSGKISVHYGTAMDSIPPDGYPVYLIPATAYTQWYLSLHIYEIKNLGPRTPTVRQGGLNGLMMRNIYRKLGYNGIPDYTKPVPFTSMDPRAFHAVRTTRTRPDGSYSFTGLPAASYLLLAHWPIKLTSTSYETTGQSGFFGDYSGTTTENTTARYALFYFAIIDPTAVSAGKTTHVIPNQYSAVLGGAPCGQYGCGRLVIDQWLSLDERSPQ